jgi:hypothetical protein
MKSFKDFIKEDGMGAGAVGVAANNVGDGKISGTGGKGGEPGVDTGKKRKVVIKSMFKRNPPKMA